MAKGFVYLVAVIDWFSLRLLSFRLSITMEADFCVEALQEAINSHSPPAIFNTDQGFIALVLQYRRCYNSFDHGEPTPMSNQNAFIRHSLNQIGDLIQQQELVQSTASKARALGDPQRQAFWDKLGLQETLLRRLLHQLHQTAVTFEWERTHPWRIPRHQRYPAGNR